MDEEFKNDHDAIITLISEVRQIREDIKDLKSGTSDKISDHEERLRDLEETVIYKTEYEQKHQIVLTQINRISRYVYIAIGGLLAFQLLVDLYFKLNK